MYTRDAKLILELSSLLKDLDTMVICISHNNVLFNTQAKAMWRIELAFSWTQLTKFAPEIKNTWFQSSIEEFNIEVSHLH